MELLKQVYNGKIPPWIHKFIKLTGKGMERFNQTDKDDLIVLGISGGKDSLSMAFALRMLQKYYKKNFRLHAAMVEWQEFPLSSGETLKLKEYFKILEIPFAVHPDSMYKDISKDDFDCYFCSRKRKQKIFRLAEEIGASKIAFGHHLDDVIETNLMNLLFRGKLDPMQPKRSFFDSKFHIIRPMTLVHEQVCANLAQALSLPVIEIDCPFKTTNLRVHVKPLIRGLYPLNKHIRSHLFEAYSDLYES